MDTIRLNWPRRNLNDEIFAQIEESRIVHHLRTLVRRNGYFCYSICVAFVNLYTIVICIMSMLARVMVKLVEYMLDMSVKDVIASAYRWLTNFSIGKIIAINSESSHLFIALFRTESSGVVFIFIGEERPSKVGHSQPFETFGAETVIECGFNVLNKMMDGFLIWPTGNLNDEIFAQIEESRIVHQLFTLVRRI